MSFFDRLEKLIEEKNITFTELERNVGLGRGTISNWKKSYPTYDKLIKVVNYLNADVSWLMQDDLETRSCNNMIKETPTPYLTSNKYNQSENYEPDVKQALDIIMQKLSHKNSAEDGRILSLYHSLGRDEKNQILGMLELKVAEQNNKKITSSFLEDEEKKYIS